jgi:hypothetical protein
MENNNSYKQTNKQTNKQLPVPAAAAAAAATKTTTTTTTTTITHKHLQCKQNILTLTQWTLDYALTTISSKRPSMYPSWAFSTRTE